MKLTYILCQIHRNNTGTSSTDRTCLSVKRESSCICNIISDHLPFDVAENVFCCGQFLYVNRHESNLFAILCYLFFVQVFFYVREFIKSCQKSFCWSFANSDLVFISQDEYCLFFDSSCFCFFFYWKFLPDILRIWVLHLERTQLRRVQ